MCTLSGINNLATTQTLTFELPSQQYTDICTCKMKDVQTYVHVK